MVSFQGKIQSDDVIMGHCKQKENKSETETKIKQTVNVQLKDSTEAYLSVSNDV